MDSTIVAVIGVLGTVMGIAGVIVSLAANAKNNAKWNGIVEQKMNTVIDCLHKVENRLAKLEDDRTSMWKEIIEIKSANASHEKSLERLHVRLDKITGGRDRGYSEDTP